MRVLLKALKWLVIAAVVVVAGGMIWLVASPPELLRVADAYTAKTVCSNVMLAGRSAEEVLAEDVQAPGEAVLKYIGVDRVDKNTFKATFFGFLAPEYALYRRGFGCTNVPDHDLAAAASAVPAGLPVPLKSDFEWPLGDQVSLANNDAINSVIADPALAGPGMRAIVVVKDGRIVAERYGEGFDPETPLLGWSMTKTVTGALVALRVAAGKLAYDDRKLFPEWTDGRAAVSLADLLAMQSGLDFNEDYGAVSDVTRMLFLEPDQAAFMRSRPLKVPPGKEFSYKTGSSVALTRIWMNTFADPEEALVFPRQALFDPIGMRTAVFETDSRGTFSGGSLLYASGRDWARFGLLLLNKGEWNGVPILPPDYYERVSTGSPVSGGAYTLQQAWTRGPYRDGDAEDGLPKDAFWALGHDGQSIAIIPSENLVVVRLGLTPSSLKYRPQVMIGKIIDAAKLTVPTDEVEPPRVSGDEQPDESALDTVGEE